MSKCRTSNLPTRPYSNFLSQSSLSVQQSQTKVRSPLTFLHREVTPKQSHPRQLHSTIHLMAQLVTLPQELHVQTIFASLLYHMSMLLHLLLYALEWLGFTLNHVSQSKRNAHAQVISSCCNLHVHTIL
jgi:hypothetical protein